MIVAGHSGDGMAATRFRWLAALAALGATCVLALGIASPTPWTGVGFLATWLMFFLVGSAWLPQGPEPAREHASWVVHLRFIVIAIAAGFASSVVVWSLSALITKSVAAGTIVLLAAACVGGFRLARARISLRGVAAPVPVCLTALGLLLGLYLFGVNEIRDGGDLVFTYRYDFDIHMQWSGLIRELGLPLVEHNGVRGVLYMPLYHTGVLVAAAGVDQLAASSPYQATRILGVGCVMLIVGAAATLAARFKLSGWQTTLCSVAPLIWGSLSPPLDLLRRNWDGLLDPYAKSVATFAAASGSLYHNLPQLAAVAISAGALVLLDRYRDSGKTTDLVVSGLLLGATAVVKPTAVIVFGPAVLIVLALARVSPRALIAFVGALAVGPLAYALPAMTAELTVAPGWVVQPENLLARRRVIEVAVLGVVLPIAIARAAELLRRETRATWRVLDVQLLAVFGGVLFAAVFVEPTRVEQANQTWSRNAAIVLAAPSLSAIVLSFANARLPARPWHTWRWLAAAVAVALFVVHLGAGAVYAVRYPTMDVQRTPADAAATLRSITAATPSTARLLADIRIVEIPFLPRRFVYAGSFSDAARPDLEYWSRIRRGGWTDTLRAFVADRDGVILGPRTSHLPPHLAGMGWRRVLQGGGYQFWAPQPTTMTGK